MFPQGSHDFLLSIDGPDQGIVINLTDRRAASSRQLQLTLVVGGPDPIVRELERIRRATTLPAQLPLPHLIMPARHDVRSGDVTLHRLHGTLAAAAARGPTDFADLHPRGRRAHRASLALVAEVVQGAPRFQDPARFSLAHGGKDRHPFPVPIRVYDETIRVMKSAVEKAKLGREEELTALKRLDAEARKLERIADGPSLQTFVASEKIKSPALEGRSGFGLGGRRNYTGRSGIHREGGAIGDFICPVSPIANPMPLTALFASLEIFRPRSESARFIRSSRR